MPQSDTKLLWPTAQDDSNIVPKFKEKQISSIADKPVAVPTPVGEKSVSEQTADFKKIKHTGVQTDPIGN